MIGIIDYDAGNIKSVEKALAYLGEETVVSRDPQVLLRADKVILPGVGSFGDAMSQLKKFERDPGHDKERNPVSWDLSWITAFI